MAHETCPHCGYVAYGDSSEIGKMLAQHIEREHNQGYRASSSWGKCGYCNGRGKDVWGIPCSYCNGSGIA
ncbi:hypothetical protein IKF89_02465 [Candidatus Saccharibacteria bacterium]|nr:hypothetical protein [Candidatus Saccharibacteria bacterium]